ncbi:tRNA (adenosine(37)-N6)-threonylcarbamoyltransferase complex dimerization subunit type 1 TsaB [Paenibacillus chartarius]|uniref:tRNA (Adenosine(37)-N6)-threonylcarbamoyltransferase complex dimerization subunit type 1 TsaB n=1 Tax=Paenibacillus chartarius TaxID=747481 RepID=A0ABV6DKV4_9BACL
MVPGAGAGRIVEAGQQRERRVTVGMDAAKVEKAGREGVIVAFDTSTTTMTTALLRGGEVLAEFSAQGKRDHSVHLLPAVKELLHGRGLRPRDVDAIAVGIGPGSYTGVRVAVSAAKTMAWTLRVPLVGVSSLAALALGAARRAGAGGGAISAGRRWLVPLVDARRSQAFTAVYEDGGAVVGGLTELAADGVRLVRDWADELRERAAAADGPVELAFCGETAGFEEMLLEAFGGGEAAGGVRLLMLPHEPAARDVGALAAARLLRGEHDDVHTFVPNYTQLAEAEVKLLAKQKQGD